jgi:hypothetical protein
MLRQAQHERLKGKALGLRIKRYQEYEGTNGKGRKLLLPLFQYSNTPIILALPVASASVSELT